MKNKNNSIYQKARASKTFMTFFGCLLLFLAFSGFVVATTISDQSVDSPTGSFTNVSVNKMNVTGDLISDTIHQVSDEGLVLAMNFNSININENIIYDLSGDNNHGINNGSIFNNSGGFNSGGAFEFNGVNNSIKIMDDDSLDFGTEDFSISFWFYPEQELGTQRFYSKGIGYQDKQFDIQFGEATKQIKVRIGDGGVTTDLVHVVSSINNWYNLVFVRKNGVGYLYVNALLKDTDTVNYNITNANNLKIGMRGYGSSESYFNGTIDEVKAYNRALSSNEIKASCYQRTEISENRKKWIGSVTVCQDDDCDYIVDGYADDEIQSAINDLCLTTGGEILIKTGLYEVVNQINITCTGIVIKGESRGVGAYNYYHDYSGGTILKAVTGFPADDSVIFVAGNGTGIRDLVVDANDIAKYGINYYQGWEKYVSNTMIFRATDTGFIASAQTIDGENAGSGNWLDHVTSADNGINGFYFVKSDYRMNDLYGWDHKDGSFIVLVGGGHQISNIHTYWSKYGIYVNGSNDNSVVSAVLEGTNVSAVYFDATYSSISDFTLTSSAMYLNDRDDEGNPVFTLNAVGHDIEGIIISGNTFNDWTTQAHMFNYTESGGGTVENSFFVDNVHYSGLGQYPDGMFIDTHTEYSNTRYFKAPNFIFDGIVNFTELFSPTNYDVSSQSLVLDFNFNNESINGNIVLDGSVENNHGTNNVSTHNSNGGFNNGGYYTFDGIDDTISLDFTSVNTSESFTYSFWINRKVDSDNQIIMAQNAFQTNRAPYFMIEANDLQFRMKNSTGDFFAEISNLETDKWIYIVGTFNGTTLLVYQNGVLEATQDYSPFNNVVDNLVIGDRGAGTSNFLNGSLDNLQIYSRELSLNEIKANYYQRTESQDAFIRQGQDIIPYIDAVLNFGSSLKRYLKGYFVNADISEKLYLNESTHYIHFNGTCIVAVGTGQTGACL